MPFHLEEFENQRAAISASGWRGRLRTGDPLLGIWIASGSPSVVELMSLTGADWLIIDAEHSAQSIPGIIDQLRAAEGGPTFTVVRTPSRDPLELGRLLDAGARGLMVPMVESADQANDVVAALRYPPRGRRGVGGGFARATRWNEISGYLGRAEETHLLIAQIETVASVEAIAQIASADGVDAVFIGPADLAASAGHLGEPGHPEVRALIEHGIAEAIGVGAVVGVNAFDPSDARRYLELGARILGVSADVTLLATAANALLAALRGPKSIEEKEGRRNEPKEG